MLRILSLGRNLLILIKKKRVALYWFSVFNCSKQEDIFIRSFASKSLQIGNPLFPLKSDTKALTKVTYDIVMSRLVFGG